MHLRRQLYFRFLELRGGRSPEFYKEFRRKDDRRDGQDDTAPLLSQLLTHCFDAVPYYSEAIRSGGTNFKGDPFALLRRLPVLTKEILRSHATQLTSRDIDQRRWYYNTSGGSTGEPVRFIQDAYFRDRSTAITFLNSSWTGCEPTDSEIRLWGSERDIFHGTEGWRNATVNRLKRLRTLNAFRMTPDGMGRYIEVLNRTRPKLIVAYAQAIYELAQFARQNNLLTVPQRAIVTSAGTLHDFMRETIESVFGCRVFNRYGSREVGNIACQCACHGGLHVAPWGNYIEIVDDNDRPVPNGELGDILVTSLNNYAMPLIRYRIGDRGRLSSLSCPCGRPGQILDRIAGRNVDAFRTVDGTLIDGEYFTHLLYFRSWVTKFQVLQRNYSEIEFRIVGASERCSQTELDQIVEKARLLLGPQCAVAFHFVTNIEPSPSGKYRYTISEVTQ
jgi:phenylacetate-CoA ligase